RCALESKKHIVIVTRDSDYGVIVKGKMFLNDWLRQEFKERVKGRQRLLLTHKLADGLRAVHATVTEDMEDAERDLLQSSSSEYTSGNLALPMLRVESVLTSS